MIRLSKEKVMAEIDRLRDETKRLNQQVRILEERIEQQKQQFQKETQQKINEYERLIKQQIHAVTEQQKQQFETKIVSLKMELEGKINREQEELVKHYKQLQKELEEARKKVARWEQDLQNRINLLQQKQQKQEQKEEESAKKYLKEAKAELERVEEMPCEKFFPGKLNLYKQNLQDAWQMMKQGIAQAAAATAVSVRAALERFSYDVEDQQKDWEEQYQELQRLTESLKQKLNIWQQEYWENDTEEEIVFADLNFWTKGWYGSTMEFIQIMDKMKERILENGVVEYLKNNSDVDFEILANRLEQIKKLLKEYENFKTFYRTSTQAAMQRAKWIEKLKGLFVEDRGYACEVDGYHVQQACSQLKSEKYFQDYNKYILECSENIDDFQGWYQVDFYGIGEIKIEVVILPIQQEYVVQNRICYHVYQGVQDNEQETLWESIAEGITTVVNDSSISIETTNNQEKKEELKISPYKIIREWVKKQEERMEKQI